MMRIHMQHKHKPDAAGVKLEEPPDAANPNEFLFNLWNHWTDMIEWVCLIPDEDQFVADMKNLFL